MCWLSNGYQHGPDGKELPSPPYIICLVRKEHYLFYNVATGRQRLSALKNVHYHANQICPKARCQNFDRSQVQIPNDWLFLLQTYGCIIVGNDRHFYTLLEILLLLLYYTAIINT